MKASDGDKLGEVIRRYNSMAVEDYQRTYSWTSDDVDDFFSDILEASGSGVGSHFFGTLIFQEVGGDQSRVTVVDGQQRLTTVFITLAAIRDSVMSLAEETIPAKSYGMAPERPAEEATRLIVSSGDSPNLYRYEANRFVKPIMDASVFAPPGTQAKIKTNHKQVTLPFRHAVRRIRSKLVEALPGGTDMEKLVFLNQLLKTITEKFRVLTIETGSLSESLDIFLTLNDRGQELGPSDIVKGKLMSSFGKGLSDDKQLGLQEQINIAWNQLTEDVKEPETFLRHYLLSTGVDKVQKKAVVNLVEGRMRGKHDTSDYQATEQFWDDLRSAAGKYTILVNSSIKDPVTKLNLNLLEGLQKSHRVFLMSVLNRPELTRKGIFEELVRLTFALSFRWAAADKGRQSLEDTFHDLAMSTRGVSKEESEIHERPPATEEDLISQLEKLVMGLDVDFHRTLSRDIDGSFISRAALYYAQYLTVGNSVAHALKDLHLEHVAPQTPTSSWRAELISGDESEFDYEDIITSIGNLTLLDPPLNHKLGNKPFKEKVSEYKKSSMYLTTDLARFEVWTKDIVSYRTEWLAEVFEQVCSVEGLKGDVTSFADWYSAKDSVDE